jgi:hypothetical protein
MRHAAACLAFLTASYAVQTWPLFQRWLADQAQGATLRTKDPLPIMPLVELLRSQMNLAVLADPEAEALATTFSAFCLAYGQAGLKRLQREAERTGRSPSELVMEWGGNAQVSWSQV